MNRNSIDEILNISEFINKIDSKEDVAQFLCEILTESEINVLSKRWKIINLLINGFSQRTIAQELGVSLCKVTRGSKILKDNSSVISKYITKENI